MSESVNDRDLLDAHQAWSARTSVYPGAGSRSKEATTYCALGLAGELGEVERAKVAWDRALFRSRNQIETDDPTAVVAARTAFVSEIGDALFYFCRWATEIGKSAGDLWTQGQANEIKSVSLLDALSRATEPLKKWVRGDYDAGHHGSDGCAECARDLAAEKQALGLAVVARTLAAFMRERGIELAEALDANRAKLERRLAEGKIRGEGSER